VGVLSDTLPYHCLRGRQAAPPTEAEVAVLEEAAHTLWVLVYDGIRYRESLPLMWTGLEVVADLLRFARLNDLTSLEKTVRDYLDQAAHTAVESRAADARKILEYVDRYGSDFEADPPKGLHWVVSGRERP
jgi:hypothetical protein